MLSFQVRAVADDNKRASDATVTLQVQDINDNSPTFSQEVLSMEKLSILDGKFFVLPLIRFGLLFACCFLPYLTRVSVLLFLFWCTDCMCVVFK